MSEKKSELCEACFKGDVKTIESLIQSGVDVNAERQDGMTSLICASRSGNLDCVKILLNNGAEMDARDTTYHSTALMFACENGHSQCVELLINNGANIETQNNGGMTVLMIASNGGHSKCVELLIESGANIEAQDADGDTALILASFEGHLDCVQQLINNGTILDIKDDGGRTALICASMDGHVECVELLLKKGANMEVRSHDGGTALVIASQRGHSQCVQLLLDRGADVNAQQLRGFSALFLACMSCHLQCIYLLLKANADPNPPQDNPMDAVFMHQFKDPPITSTQRCMAAFLLMCHGCDVKQATGLVVLGGRNDDRLIRHQPVRDDYRRIHQHVDQRHAKLFAVLDRGVVVDTRLHRKENGLYHEPLEQVLAYNGMLLEPRVLNIHEDDKKQSGHALWTESFEAIEMACDRYITRVCSACRETITEEKLQCICDDARYCSKQCQTKHWKTTHKALHKQIMDAKRKQEEEEEQEE